MVPRNYFLHLFSYHPALKKAVVLNFFSWFSWALELILTTWPLKTFTSPPFPNHLHVTFWMEARYSAPPVCFVTSHTPSATCSTKNQGFQKHPLNTQSPWRRQPKCSQKGWTTFNIRSGSSLKTEVAHQNFERASGLPPILPSLIYHIYVIGKTSINYEILRNSFINGLFNDVVSSSQRT